MNFYLEHHRHRLSANFGLFGNGTRKEFIDRGDEQRQPPLEMMGFQRTLFVQFNVFLDDVLVVEVFAEQHRFPEIAQNRKVRFGRDAGDLREEWANLFISEHPSVKGFDQLVEVGAVGYVRSQNWFQI